MGVHAKITYCWPEGGMTECEVSSDQAAHPDLIDELVRRVLDMYRAAVGGDQ